MQGARKKISKKELKEDQLITAYVTTRRFLDRHGKSVAIVAVVLVVIAIITGLVIRSKMEANVAAGYEIYKAGLMFDRGDIQGARDKLHFVLETYPGTANSERALVELAANHFQATNFDSAIFYAEEFLRRKPDDPILACSALAIKAASLEEKCEYMRAGNTYLEAAEEHRDLFTTPVYLVDAGRCFNLAGMDDRAVELYQRVLREYPDSKEAARANEQIARAGGTPIEVTPRMKLF